MISPGAQVWIALGHTDMRKGIQGLALLVQQGLKHNPHGGDLFVFRGRAGSLLKIIWHDGIGIPPRSPPSSASGRQGSHSPITCRANVSPFLRPVPDRRVAVTGSRSWAKTSPRRSR